MHQLIGIGGAGPTLYLHALLAGVRISATVLRSDGHLETVVAPVAASGSIALISASSGVSKRLVHLKVIPNGGASATVDIKSATNVDGEFARQTIPAGQQLTFSEAEGWHLSAVGQCCA